MENERERENERQMLMGNIARINLSNDIEEIENMRTWAHKRIDDIADYKLQKINEINS